MFDFKGFLLLIIALFHRVIVVSVDNHNENLLSVVVVFRHGARTPETFYTNDPYYYNTTLFPEGTGQLTNEGKNQQYALGLWLRSRYDGWLPTSYNLSDIYVQSTNYDRTLMSAQCNLAGLYAPTGSQIWNSSVPNWQPIPIHTIPDEYDPILANGVPCNKWSMLRDLVESDPYFVDIYTQYSEVFKYLSNNTGDSVTTLSNIKKLCDTLYVEREQYDLELPSWASEVYPDPLNQLVGYYFTQSTFNVTMARLVTGRFYHKIYRYFRDAINASVANSQPRFLMFSAHESTLGNFLNSMNAFDLQRPPYAGALIFELRRNLTTDGAGTYLNIFYKKDGQINNISANGCGYDCPLDDFREHLKQVIVNKTNWEVECADTKISDGFDDYVYDEERDLD